MMLLSSRLPVAFSSCFTISFFIRLSKLTGSFLTFYAIFYWGCWVYSGMTVPYSCGSSSSSESDCWLSEFSPRKSRAYRG